MGYILKYKHFFLAFIIIYLYNLFLIPANGISPEVFAESGTNFFYNAKYKGLIDNFLTTDAGYLATLPRIFAVIGNYLVPPKYIFVFYQQITLICTSIALSFFALPIFSHLVKEDSYRFIGCLFLLFYRDFEIYNFINIAYFGAIFVILYLSREEFQNNYILAIFFLILALSKGIYIAFIPFIIVYFIWHKHISIALLSLLIGGIIQIYILRNSPDIPKDPFNIIYLSHLFLISIKSSLLILFGRVSSKASSLINLAISIISYGFIIKLLIQNKFSEVKARAKFFFSLMIVYCFSLGFASVIYYKFSSGRVDFETIKIYINSRIFFIPAIILFFIIFISIFTIPNIKKGLAIILYIGAVMASPLFYPKIKYFKPHKLSQSFSDWQSFYHLTERDKYCIPINPYFLAIEHNCRYLAEPVKLLASDKIIYQPFDKIDLSKINYNEIIMIGALLENNNKEAKLASYDKTGKLVEIIEIFNKSTKSNFAFYLPYQRNNIAYFKFLNETKIGFKEKDHKPIILLYGTANNMKNSYYF